MTGLLPPWAHSGGPYALLERLYDRAERERMRRETAAHRGNQGELEGMIVSAVKSQRNKRYEGLSIARIAGKLQKDPWDVVCDLMIEEKLQATFYTFSGDMRDVKVIMTHPAHMFASDGLRIGGMPNPRSYGTFARALGQRARDEKVIPLEQAIRKMTSFPAQRFGLRDRGLLWDGMKADIVVFNPATVNAQATFPEPKRFPVGIEYVLVNGQVVIDRGQHTGALPGEPVTMTGEVSG
jgi:N-acyl-D-amino-acid deacylase